MIIAHLPAGYLLTKTLQRISNLRGGFAMGLIGSVFPDADLIYFYAIDHQQTHHHLYWLHLPVFWLIVSAVALIASTWLSYKVRMGMLCFLVVVWLHLLLDTIASPMFWLLPFSPMPTQWLEIPVRHSFWVWNYVFHPVFAVECAIWLAAGAWYCSGYFSDKGSYSTGSRMAPTANVLEDTRLRYLYH